MTKRSAMQSSLLQKHLVKLVKQVQIVAGTTVEIFTVKLTWLQVLFQSWNSAQSWKVHKGSLAYLSKTQARFQVNFGWYLVLDKGHSMTVIWLKWFEWKPSAPSCEVEEKHYCFAYPFNTHKIGHSLSGGGLLLMLTNIHQRIYTVS